jgi:hypothetical protein
MSVCRALLPTPPPPPPPPPPLLILLLAVPGRDGFGLLVAITLGLLPLPQGARSDRFSLTMAFPAGLFVVLVWVCVVVWLGSEYEKSVVAYEMMRLLARTKLKAREPPTTRQPCARWIDRSSILLVVVMCARVGLGLVREGGWCGCGVGVSHAAAAAAAAAAAGLLLAKRRLAMMIRRSSIDTTTAAPRTLSHRTSQSNRNHKPHTHTGPNI